MNIGIVTTWFPAGGGYVSKAYRDILSKEHYVFIYARGGKVMQGDDEWDDEQVVWAPRHYNGTNTKHLLKWASEKKIDVLLFNEQRYWKPIIAAKKAGICVGAYIDYYTQATVPAFEIYDFLICNTERHYSVFSWHKGAHYIPWGTDINKFSPKECSKSSPLKFIISSGWQGMYSGDRRGTLLAIKAFHKIKGECKLIIYSQVELSSCLPEWQELIRGDNRIEFRYGTYDPFPFNEGDVYLYPSRLDGIGLSLPEAISSGLASITTDNPPMSEFVKHDVNGKLVKVEKYLGRGDGYYWAESICDIKCLTNAMQSYLDDEKLLKKHKTNARTFAVEKLNWERNANQLSNIIISAFQNRKVLDKSTAALALNLDKVMSPSFMYRILSAISSFIVYKRKK
jgi:1,2-diacylglycerol 3-alpha-glucosyltransferase